MKSTTYHADRSRAHKADKEEIVKQWNSDPCGANAAAGLTMGTDAFYQRIDHDRYRDYAPWMTSVMGFDQFRNKQLLEVGFGMGTDLFQFARHGAMVSGIDLTPKHLEIARQRFAYYGMRADLRLGDAEMLPYADETFDVVYTFGVIHHTPNTQQAINEIYRVLRPGGCAIIAVYHKWSAFFVLRTILTNYLWTRRFLHTSWREAVSRIEYRAHSDAHPLVKVYGRRRMMGMVRAFRITHVDIRHLHREDFGILQRFVHPRWLPRLERSFGWYLIVRCVK